MIYLLTLVFKTRNKPYTTTLPPIRTNFMNIDIIGAGIGGLTTAIALEQKGIKTRIFEQAEQIKEVGAGIFLGVPRGTLFHQKKLTS